MYKLFCCLWIVLLLLLCCCAAPAPSETYAMEQTGAAAEPPEILVFFKYGSAGVLFRFYLPD